jgi:folylpolyglutamate synthase/dihydropteroate synthase
VNVDVILDVGHNPAAIEAMGNRLHLEFPGHQIRFDVENLSTNIF